jgi:hypothetical protein
MEAGANPQAKDDEGKTPADLARQSKFPSVATYIEQFNHAQLKAANLLV